MPPEDYDPYANWTREDAIWWVEALHEALDLLMMVVIQDKGFLPSHFGGCH